MASRTTITPSVTSRWRLGSIPSLPVVRRHFHRQRHGLARLGLPQAHIVDDDELGRRLELVEKLANALVRAFGRHARANASELRFLLELLIEVLVAFGESHVRFLRERGKARVRHAARFIEVRRQYFLIEGA